MGLAQKGKLRMPKLKIKTHKTGSFAFPKSYKEEWKLEDGDRITITYQGKSLTKTLTSGEEFHSHGFLPGHSDVEIEWVKE